MFFRKLRRETVAASVSGGAEAGVPDSQLAETAEAGAAPAEADSAQTSERPQADHDVPAAANAQARQGWQTTDDLVAVPDPVGQQRAREAFQFGLAMGGPGYNILVAAPAGLAGSDVLRAAVRGWCQSHAAGLPPPPDRVIVCDPAQEGRDVLLQLAHGHGVAFAGAWNAAMLSIAATAAEVFTADTHDMRRRAISEAPRAGIDGPLARLESRAEEQNVALLRTPTGYVLAPMHEGEVVRAETFRGLPQTFREDVEQRIARLEGELVEILAATPVLAREAHAARVALEREAAHDVVVPIFDGLRATNEAGVVAAQFFDLAETAIVESLVRCSGEIVLGQDGSHGTLRSRLDRWWRRNRARVLLSTDTAAVIELREPNAVALAGCIEQQPAGRGARRPAMPIPGALHRAEGGVLILDAAALLDDSPARAILRRSLVGEITWAAASGTALAGLATPSSIKVVLLGDATTRARLDEVDPRLSASFKVTAAFAPRVALTAEHEDGLAAQIAWISGHYGLLPVTAAGVDTLVQRAARDASAEALISQDVEHLCEIVREADHWARRAGSSVIEATHVAEAMRARDERAETVWPDGKPVRGRR
ncbi:MAG: AAA family ATPase [Hyphomicrobiaceae bacterium]